MRRTHLEIETEHESYFLEDKKTWTRLYRKELKRILADPGLLVDAFNERESLNKHNGKHNHFTYEELCDALEAIDDEDASIYTIHDLDRFGQELKSCGFTTDEIAAMPKSVALTYEAAIFKAKRAVTYGGPAFHAYLNLYNNPDLQHKANSILKDQRTYEDSLPRLAKPIIEAKEKQRLQKPFFQRHPWVKYALIGAAIAVVAIGIGVGTAASFGALPAVIGAGVVIGGLVGLKGGLAAGIGLTALGIAVVSAFSFASTMIGKARDRWHRRKLSERLHESPRSGQGPDDNENKSAQRRTIIIEKPAKKRQDDTKLNLGPLFYRKSKNKKPEEKNNEPSEKPRSPNPRQGGNHDDHS